MRYIALVLILVLVSPTLASGSSGHHQKCKPPYTQLYVYTEPVQKECLLLTHPNHSTMMKESANNTIFNSGTTAAYKAIHEEGKSRSFSSHVVAHRIQNIYQLPFTK